MTRASDTAKLLGAGATILDGTTISTADNTAQLTLTSTDADGSRGPQLALTRTSASPADNDLCGVFKINGKNDAAEDFELGEIVFTSTDVSNGSEDSKITINGIVAGASAGRLNMTPSEAVFNEDSLDIDFRVESNGNNNMLFVDGGENIVAIGKEGSHTIGSFANTFQIEGTTGSTSSMSICRNSNSAGGSPYLHLAKTRGTSVGSSTIVQSGDSLGYIIWAGADGTNRDTNAAMIKAVVDGTPGENDMPGRIEFSTTPDGATAPTQKMQISASGNVFIGKTAESTTQNGFQFKQSGECIIGRGANDTVFIFQDTNGNNTVGNISITNSSTVYNTSSDYRLKENVTTSWDATTRLKQLKPSRFNFIIDADKTVDGFLAHEVSSIVPEAISGTKDGTEDITNVVLNADDTVNTSGVSQAYWTAGKLSTTDEQGNTVDPIYASNTTWVASKTIPKYQSIDQSKLVPLLVKTIQELEARITALES